MKNKVAIKLLTICLLALTVAPEIKAEYYMPDFFPIGLTGLNWTAGGDYQCPYQNKNGGWGWTPQDNPERNEQSLVFGLGINCIGSEDLYPDYLIDLKPTSFSDPIPNNRPSEYNYLHKVCAEAPPNNPIYIIPSGLWIDSIRVHGCAGWADEEWLINNNCEHVDFDYARFPWESRYKNDHDMDTLKESDRSNFNQLCAAKWIEQSGYTEDCSALTIHNTDETFHHPFVCYFNKNTRASTIFRDWVGESQYIGYGPDEFRYCSYNWDTDPTWNRMVDIAVDTLETHFNLNTDHDDYIWGFNLLTEDPAIARGVSDYNHNDTYEGVYAADNRVLNRFRTKTLDGKNRMIIAKYLTWPLHKKNINIFQHVPNIDAFVVYSEGWVLAQYNYGEQELFDWYLYGILTPRASGYPIWGADDMHGYHNTAVYFQKYGNTPGGPAGQKRRWIAAVCLKCSYSASEPWKAASRHPCPPELRCAVFLALARGAKGILFHGWSHEATENQSTPNLLVPYTGPRPSGLNLVSLRDPNGWPYGMSPSTDPTYSINHHFLNNGQGTTYWHTNATARHDHTYTYLADTLIPEIKAIAPVLMQLDWVNGYSLNSTDPEWASPCPHDYVADVWGVSYMDLALFDHPYEPTGVEYFMLVNREGIADMTNRTVSVALDAGHWPQEDSLVLTDIAHKENPQTLVRDGDRYVFTQVFEPGEGKLYRVAPINEAPIAINNNRP